ncbi:MAG: 50S ribosomal protein L24 [Thermoguttaceae bacterium]|jgi:large subunit ribosomal protein L24|nr:50S ribosomal protein L24 [Thermoguttaceae bacterium]MBR4751890.1 50S ribosomal protein L24 [Thermoguttaceae bacterium]MBR5757402.1 50S ribosomal protein L24 [Thermoguttaceae bacterium]
MRIKNSDKVVVLSGKDKGKVGKVMAVDLQAGKVTVEGVNEVKRHVRRSQRNMQGGRLSKNMPIPVGKVMFVCPACGKPTRVGYKFDENGKKVRFCKKCDAVVVEIPYTKNR